MADIRKDALFEMNKTPILVLAFNRPNTLKRQLERIQKLSHRNVLISIDGQVSSSKVFQDLTVRVANEWQNSTHHDVRIIERKTNLGIYDHLPSALDEFFKDFSHGLILEDDIEFIPQFVNFIDQYSLSSEMEDFWSICGHNPQGSSNYSLRSPSNIIFRHSYFHSVWGWATSKSVALNFLNDYYKKVNFREVNEVLRNVSKNLTHDPFLQKAFLATWLRKIKGWEQRRVNSGWDTRWVYQAWKQQKLSLVPDISLSRECLDQSEGQTHIHESFGGSWINRERDTLYFNIEKLDKRTEIDHLGTWGIRRRYSWFYAKRIKNEIRQLVT